MKAIRPCYPEGKTKAFTLSYDDGTVEDRRLVPIFNKNKLKATFHINSGPILEGNGGRISKEEVKDLYAGHEISVHSVTHPFLFQGCNRRRSAGRPPESGTSLRLHRARHVLPDGNLER